MLLKRLLTSKRPIALVTFEDVGWGVQVLTEGLLAVECSIMLFAFINWIVGWGVEVLIEGSLSVKCPIALITLIHQIMSW